VATCCSRFELSSWFDPLDEVVDLELHRDADREQADGRARRLPAQPASVCSRLTRKLSSLVCATVKPAVPCSRSASGVKPTLMV
jgi:hypothetical protein